MAEHYKVVEHEGWFHVVDMGYPAALDNLSRSTVFRTRKKSEAEQNAAEGNGEES